jgi:hypothetical protein
MTMSDDLHLDGNAAAGYLADLFPFDITAASLTCDGCGQSSLMGALLLYDLAMGAVFRCPGCLGLMICVTKPKGVLWADLRGVRILRVALAKEST